MWRRLQHQTSPTPSRNASKDTQQQVGEPSLLLSAARIKLRNLGDPHIAAALLEHILGISRPRGRDEEGPDVSAAARLLLTEAKRAIKAGMGRVLEYAGGPAHWPRRPLILPGNECTIVLAPDGEVPEAGVPVEAPRTPPQVMPPPPPPPKPSVTESKGKEVADEDDEDAALAALEASMFDTTEAAASDAREFGATVKPLDISDAPVVQAQISGASVASSVITDVDGGGEPVDVTDVSAEIVVSGALAKDGEEGGAGIIAGAPTSAKSNIGKELWRSVRTKSMVVAILEIGRRRARRERDPMWGFLLEVRAWEPPREQRVDSPTQQLSHAIGALLAVGHAAVLVAGEPLVDAEIEQSRWLSSPIFASGLTAVHLPTAHPLRYLTAHQIDTNSSSAASSLAVSNPTAIDGVLPSEQAFLLELTKGMDLGIKEYGCERLHEKICSVLSSKAR